jgi:hypothetical protein
MQPVCFSRVHLSSLAFQTGSHGWLPGRLRRPKDRQRSTQDTHRDFPARRFLSWIDSMLFTHNPVNTGQACSLLVGLQARDSFILFRNRLPVA